MSQDDLARKITELPPESLNFHQQTIQKIENGNRGVSLTDAVLISAALDVDLNTMLMRPDGPDRTSIDLRNDRLRRDMHVAHLALKELESTLEKLEQIYDIAPGDEQRAEVDREIKEGPGKKTHGVVAGVVGQDAYDEAQQWAKERHDSLHEQIAEELSRTEAGHGVDN